jgi:hypothetical protein
MGRRFYPEGTPTIFVHGGCDINDAVNIELIRSKYQLDDPRFGSNKHIKDITTDHRFRETPSIVSMYSQPSSIAERVYDSLEKLPINNRSHVVAAEEILKYPVLEFYKKHASTNDIMILGFLNEFNLKIKSKNECFTISSQFKNFTDKNDPLHWLYSEYITNEKYYSPFFEDRNLQETKEYLKDYAKELYNIFKNRLVIVDTHLASFYYNSSIESITLSSNSIPFYKPLNVNTVDIDYMRKWMKTLIRIFKHFYPVDVPVVSINNNECFRDPNHKFGPAATHLHPYSINQIGVALYRELEKINNK